MSGFRAVNTTLTVAEPPPRLGEETTPTTPRPTKFFGADQPHADMHTEDSSSIKTPTKDTFAVIDSFAGIAGQRPLPPGPFAPSQAETQPPAARNAIKRESSHRSTKSVDSTGDADQKSLRDGDDSDNESVTSDTNRPSKKKKGQRFFCRDFPPCQLSFTRSEHLARHIRKHTGERPFQCHCSRRFSRLDNLRQHAQTVHVNEDIPDGSLAATGTRFQRQIRTDRVRPPTSRSRASTFSSQGSHSRGHSRNLSASSITSVSTASSLGDDIRSRPSSMIIGDSPARTRLSLDTFKPSVTSSPNGGVQHYFPVGGRSPSGYSTPTSATFSGGTGSPRFPSGLQSPISTVPRAVAWDGRTTGRRLSVPSSNPFQAPPGSNTYPPPFITPLTSATASGQSSIFASPTTSGFRSRHESAASAADNDWRRRTWHPGTHTGLGQRASSSSLSYFQTPDSPHPLPLPSQNPPGQVTRLPGIESFDHAPPQPSIGRQPSPMQLDPPSQPPPPQVQEQKRRFGEERRGHASRVSWDMGINRGLNKLDLTNATPPKETPGWSQYSNTAPVNVVMSRQGTTPNPGFQPQQQQAAHVPHPIQPPPPNGERLRFSDQPTTPRKNKRLAWYNGPIQAQPYHHSSVGLRTSPEDSSSSEGVPTPSNTSQGEYHPAIMHSNGYIEQQHPPPSYPSDEPKMAVTSAPHPPSSAAPQTHGGYPTSPMQGVQHSPHQAHQAAFALQSVQQQELRPSPFAALAAQHQQHAHQQSPPQMHEQPSPPHSQSSAPFGDMRRLEALVAVATGEGQVAGR